MAKTTSPIRDRREEDLHVAIGDVDAKHKDEKVKHSKKRKAASSTTHQDTKEDTNSMPSKRRRPEPSAPELDTSRPTAIFQPTTGRPWTLSIALPGSILLNTKKPDHKTLLAGRIARAASIFCVDEIVIFDDAPNTIDPNVISPNYIQGSRNKHKSKQDVLDAIREEDEAWQNPDQFLYHVLSFAECPPNLRHDHADPALSVFQKHANLQWTGCLPSMDMPHHLRSHEWCRFREGVVIRTATQPTQPTQPPQTYVFVKCGLPFPVRLRVPADTPMEPATRLTLRFDRATAPPSWPHLSRAQCEALAVRACAASAPRQQQGYYWGYTVRRAASLSAVFSACDFARGYDYCIGTSERGVNVHAVLRRAAAPASVAIPVLPDSFEHALLVFGGQAGLERAFANDETLRGLGDGLVEQLFDAWVNLVPGQGSRTIRTEEAVELGLCMLSGWVAGNANGRSKESAGEGGEERGNGHGESEEELDG